MAIELFDLTGRVALVTGGSKGLGKAMAKGLAEMGADVVISSRHEDELAAAQKEIEATARGKVVRFPADMTRRDQVRQLAERALSALGHVDILINNAGSNKPQPIDAFSDEDWDYLIELNLSSTMALTRAIVPSMKERRWGRIIFISSIMGLVSKPGRGAYSATKAGVIGLAHACALELGEFGITVNCLAPGPFLTDLPASVMNEKEKQAFTDRTALGRWGEPGELVGPALLLASPAGSYITGATLVVDGGTVIKTF